MSVMWSRPSTPPRSMKAPKSVMFLTMPFRVWPTCSSFIRTSRLVLRSASSSTRRLTTMLRRRLFNLMILNSKLWPSSSSMLGTRRRAIWLPGRNASTPIRSTTTPPLIFLTSVPETASSFSWASRIRSQTRMKSAFFFEMLQENLDLVPFLERARVLELVDRHGAFRLESDVENDGGVGHAQHLRLDDLAFFYVGERSLVQLRHLRDFVRRILLVQIGANAEGGASGSGGGSFGLRLGQVF